jgi:hypothetical protein
VHRFGAPWDRTLRVATTAGLAIVVAAGAAAAIGVWSARGPAAAAALAVAIAAIPLSAWALAPRGFTVGAGMLRVERNAWRGVEIPLASVRATGLLPPESVRGALRLLGTGGLFGHYGLFRSSALGRFRLYATRSDGFVAVRTAGGLFVLTPDRPEAFVEILLGVAPAVRVAPRPP